MSTAKMLESILSDMMNMKNVEACALISHEGLLICGTVSPGLHAESLAAVTAAMVSAAEIVMKEMDKGTVRRVITESKQCTLIAVEAGTKAQLMVMASPDAGLGSILVKMNELSEKVKPLLL